MSDLSPLSGVKRKSNFEAVMSVDETQMRPGRMEGGVLHAAGQGWNI
jgi:hypothetical protein